MINDGEMTDDEAGEYFSWLIENGGYLISGVSEDGEIVYTPDIGVLKEIAPDLADVLLEKTMSMISELIKNNVMTENDYYWDENEQDFIFMITPAIEEYLNATDG